jgi:site-specific DNA recombinase
MNTGIKLSQSASKETVGKRVVGYFRVSSEEQLEGYSIAAQKRAYHQYVESHGYISIAEYSDEGKSARTDNIKRRPQFAQMLQDAEAGLFETIIVHKMDRFSRSLQVAVKTFEILGKSNVGLASISEPNLDYSSPQGKLFMHMLWALAQFYSDNLSNETKKGKNERKMQGLYNGTLPFGVVKGENGIPVPDLRTPEFVDGLTNYDGLKLIFEKAANGDSCRKIAEELNTLGFRTTGNRGNNLFTKDTVNAILRSRFYLGELPDGEYNTGHSRRGMYTKGMAGKHAAFIPAELWDAAQHAILANSNSGRLKIRSKAQVYSLSGLAVCGYCGGKMHARKDKNGEPLFIATIERKGLLKIVSNPLPNFPCLRSKSSNIYPK